MHHRFKIWFCYGFGSICFELAFNDYFTLSILFFNLYYKNHKKDLSLSLSTLKIPPPPQAPDNIGAIVFCRTTVDVTLLFFVGPLPDTLIDLQCYRSCWRRPILWPRWYLVVVVMDSDIDLNSSEIDLDFRRWQSRSKPFPRIWKSGKIGGDHHHFVGAPPPILSLHVICLEHHHFFIHI